MKTNLQGGTSPKTLRHLVWLALLSAALGAHAASVVAGGYTNDFSSPPDVADFATVTIAGSSGTIANAAGLDAAVAALTAASITTTLTPTPVIPAPPTGAATYNSTDQNLQTRPTSVTMSVLMATLINNAGANAGTVSLSYSLTQSNIVNEEVNGVRVYYSLTGAASSWNYVPAWSATAAGQVSAIVTLAGPWNVGSPLYLLFADDNGSSSPDTANQIDNFSFAVSGPAPELPVAIVSQPQNQAIFESQSAAFTVGVSGNPPYTFQWYRGTDPIANATNASYTLVNAQLTDSGAQFSVVAANAASNISYTVTSSVATLTVTTAPTTHGVPLQQATATFSQLEQSGNFSIANTVGSNAPVYPGWAIAPNIAGQTAVFETVNDIGYFNGTTLTFTLSHNHPFGPYHNLGRFRISLTTDSRNTFADGLSTGGDVTANWIVLDPILYSATNGTTLTALPDHSILASGVNPTNDTYIVTVFTTVTGITGFRLEVLQDPSLPFSGPGRNSANGNFVLTHFQVNAASTNVAPTNTSPSILTQPQGQTVAVGTDVTLAVFSVGTSPLTYQWRLDGSPLSNATNSTLPFTNVQLAQSGDYTVIVANQFGSVTSQIATLTVFIPANGQDVPLQQATATFSQFADGGFSIAKIVGSNAPVYPGWAIAPSIFAQTAAFETVNDLGFANGTLLTFTLSHNLPIAPFHNLGRFRISVTSDPRNTFADGLIIGGDVTANWTVLDPISFSATNGTTLTELSDHSILASGINPANDIYTVTLLTTNTGITGFRLEVLQDPSLPHSGPGRNSDNGNFVLTHFQVKAAAADPSPSILSQPQGLTVKAGTNVAFSVFATGTSPLEYQWSFNGSSLLNATNSTLAYNNVQPEQAGNYTVIVANQFGSATSQVATLVVIAPPTNCLSAPAGIVGWWPLDGNVSDIVSNNLTTLAGNATYVSGKAAAGLSFDGVSNSVRATASAALNVGLGSGFTLELWINPAQANTQMPVIEWAVPGLSSVHLWTSVSGSGNGPGSLYANVVDTSCNAHTFSSPAGILQSGTFQHVALTYNKSSGIARLYLNGVKVAEQNLGSFTPKTDGNVYFGVRPSVSGQGPGEFLYSGSMDEISIYNRALSSTEILDIAERGALGKCKPEVPPSIVTQPQGGAVPAGTNITLNVVAGGSAPLAYLWTFNGSTLTDATNSTLAFNNVQPVQSGDYTVIVANQFGSVTSQVATLTVFIPRTLALQAQPQSQEGTRVQIPLTLISTGDIAGMTFTINYSTNYLRDLQFNWSPLLLAGFNQENQNTPGVVSASFALSENIPAGTQTVATLDFLLRSVPATLDTALTVTLQDASDAQGNTVPVIGTVVQGCSQHILVRRIIGDNNANDRLDVGDATVILRFLAALDPVRAWDITGNDVNQNTSLDSGDVTKVLRAAAGIDPQPTVPGVSKNRSSQAAPPAQLLQPAGQFILTPDRTNGTPGQQVKVQVRLQNNSSPLSGTAFTLNYPTNALRLANSSAYQLGPIVPGGTLAQWNVAPSQNNFTTQNGHLTLAASSANPWPSSNGVLAEITFTIQAGATSQYLWPLTVTGAETAASGYDNHLFPTANASFIGRVPVAGQLASLVRLPGGQFQFSLAGDASGTYAVDASANLINWTAIQTNSVPAGGSLLVQDPAATGQPYRFYRVRSLY